jgi:uncharacterized protein (TIGR02453 family)
VTFKGWPAAALDFYAGLEADNSKAYWEEHRATYEECVKQPFLDLSAIIADEFGPFRLFRPYRDVRFSKDKTPYKTTAAAVTEGEGGTSYYVSLSATGLYAGSGYHHLEADQLERFRAAVADSRTGPRLAAAVAAVRAKKCEIGTRDSLKRVPRGFDADHPRADLLRMKGLHAGREFGTPLWLHTAGAAERIVTAWRDAAPVNTWLDRNVGPSTAAPPEPD